MRGMNLGQSINTYHPAEALDGEVGTFKVKVPQGCELVLTRKPSGEVHLRWGNPNGGEQTYPFLITKISEPAAGYDTVTPITKTA
jgi:hypothetical protein